MRRSYWAAVSVCTNQHRGYSSIGLGDVAIRESTRRRYLEIYRDVIKRLPRDEVARKHGCSECTVRKAIAYFKDQSRLTGEEELRVQIDAIEAKLYHLRQKVEEIEGGCNETEEVIEGESRRKVKRKRVYNWAAAVSYWREIRESEKELVKLKGLLKVVEEDGEPHEEAIERALSELEEEGDL